MDRTTHSNENFNLQRRVIRFSSFKKAKDPENEYDAYESRGKSPMKSKYHYRKYRNWTEHEFDKIVRELPPIVSQHQMEKATGVKEWVFKLVVCFKDTRHILPIYTLHR